MTTLTSRKAVREALTGLLDDITTFVQFYDHQTKDFNEQSPVGMIHSDGSMTRFPGYADEHHGFWITTLWKREDAAATEDGIDDLAQAVRQKLLDNVVNALWNDIHFDEQMSVAGYVEIASVQYRIEEFRIWVHAIGS